MTGGVNKLYLYHILTVDVTFQKPFDGIADHGRADYKRRDLNTDISDILIYLPPFSGFHAVQVVFDIL